MEFAFFFVWPVPKIAGPADHLRYIYINLIYINVHYK